MRRSAPLVQSCLQTRVQWPPRAPGLSAQFQHVGARVQFQWRALDRHEIHTFDESARRTTHAIPPRWTSAHCLAQAQSPNFPLAQAFASAQRGAFDARRMDPFQYHVIPFSRAQTTRHIFHVTTHRMHRWWLKQVQKPRVSRAFAKFHWRKEGRRPREAQWFSCQVAAQWRTREVHRRRQTQQARDRLDQRLCEP